MKKIYSLLFFILFYVLPVSAQDDLETIFDDGEKYPNFEIMVSSDVLTTLAGTVNLYGEVLFKQTIGIQIGLGLMPMNYMIDLSSPFNLLDSTFFDESNYENGFFYDIGITLSPFSGGDRKRYFYCNLKQWVYGKDIPITDNNTGNTNMVYTVRKRFKTNGGIGYSYTPFKNIGFYGQFGIYFGGIKEKNSSQGAKKKYKSSQAFTIGVDFGLGAFYSF